MKKNVKIHLWIDSELLANLQKQAEQNDVTLSDICRMKLREDLRFDKLFDMVERIAGKIKY